MVLEKIKALVAEQFDVEEDAVEKETSFEELGAEEEDVSDFISALEDEFDISLTDEEQDHISTVGDAVDIVKEIIRQ